jgi:hypothetical protein
VVMLAMVTALVPAAVNSRAQEQKPPTLPLAEMQRLSKLYVGTWTYTETYPKSAFSPNGGVNTGVYTSELGPGGNSIINHFHSKGPVGDFEGMIVMTWDPKESAYKGYVFGDSFPAAVVQTGRWENDALVYRYEFFGGRDDVRAEEFDEISCGREAGQRRVFEREWGAGSAVGAR